MKKENRRGEPCVRLSKNKDPKQNVGADNKNRGITLIALVITIIVLLILAGVSLKLIAGGNGIIGKTENAVDTHTEAAAFEKLNLKLIEYIADKVEDANVVLKEYLESIDGCSEVRDDEAEDNQGGYIVVIDGYEFRVTADGKILERLGKATSPRILLTQTGASIEVSIIERGEIVTNLEILDSAGNVLTTVAKEDMTKKEQAYVFNHTFTATGTYVVKVTTEENEYTKQVMLDLTPPAEPVISSNYGYPIIKSTGISMDGTTTIKYDTSEDIKNYYSIDGKATWQEYTGAFQYAQAGTIYAKSVKESNGTEKTASKKVSVKSDAIPWALCTASGGSLIANGGTSGGVTNYYYMNVDNSAFGKKFSLDYSTGTNSTVYNWVRVRFYNLAGNLLSDSGAFLGSDSYNKRTTRMFTIPNGAAKISFTLFSKSRNDTAYLYKVYLNK